MRMKDEEWEGLFRKGMFLSSNFQSAGSQCQLNQDLPTFKIVSMATIRTRKDM